MVSAPNGRTDAQNMEEAHGGDQGWSMKIC